MMDKRMARLRIARENREILLAQRQEPIDDRLRFRLFRLLERFPELRPRFAIARNASIPGGRAIVFEPLHIRFVQQPAGGGPNGHPGVRRIVLLNGAIQQFLPEGRAGGFEELARRIVEEVA